MAARGVRDEGLCLLRLRNRILQLAMFRMGGAGEAGPDFAWSRKLQDWHAQRLGTARLLQRTSC